MIDGSYPGGVAFLEESRQAKVEELVGIARVNSEFADIRIQIREHFSNKQEKINSEIAQAKKEIKLNQV